MSPYSSESQLLVLPLPDSVFHTLLEALRAHCQGPCFLVGGFLRDTFLNQGPCLDLDLVMPVCEPETWLALAHQYGWQGFILDQPQCFVRLVLHPRADASITGPQTRTLDIALQKSGGILSDLAQRDCTINAMALEIRHVAPDRISGVLWDPCQGRADLDACRLRTPKLPNLTEDPLRMLRMVRLAHTRGMHMQPDMLDYIQEHHAQLAQSSPFRIQDEIWKIVTCTSRRLSRALQDMARTRLYAHVFFCPRTSGFVPERLPDTALAFMDHLQSLVTRMPALLQDSWICQSLPQTSQTRFLDAAAAPLAAGWTRSQWWLQTGLILLPWLAWAGDSTVSLDLAGKTQAQCEQDLEAYLARMHYSAREHRHALAVVQSVVHLLQILDADDFNPADRGRLHHLIMAGGWTRAVSVLLDAMVVLDAAFALGDGSCHPQAMRFRAAGTAILELLHRSCLDRPRPLVSGTDVQQWFGLEPGPRIGAILRALLEAEACQLIVSPEEARHYIRKLL